MDMLNLRKLGDRHYEIRFKYTNPLDGKQKTCRRRIEGTLEDARAERDRLKAAARQGDLNRPQKSNGPKRMKDYRESFIRARKTKRGWKVGTSTRERDEYALDHHIMPAMGDWFVREITPADLDRVVDYWQAKEQPEGKGRQAGEPYSVASVNQWIKVLRLYLKWCARLEQIKSPAADLASLAKPKEDAHEKTGTALTAEQAALFLGKMRTKYPQWYPMCLLGFTYGMRFSSLSALRWQDVKWDQGIIVFAESQYRGERTKGDKTGKVIKAPLVPPVEKALADHREWLIENDHPGLETGLVTPSKVPDGAQNGHVSDSALRSALTRTCKAVEKDLRKQHADPSLTFPRITSHDFRRTANTLAYGGPSVDHHAIQVLIITR